MRSLIAPTLALVALFGLTTTASTKTEEPYRIVTSVVIIPEIDSELTNFYINCHDDGAEELWDVQAHGGPVDEPASVSLQIDGTFQFGIASSILPLSITVTGSTGESVTVDATSYQTDTDYLALLSATADQRSFVLELMQEYKVLGTMQGLTPTVEVPDSDYPPPDGDWAFGLGGGSFVPMSAISIAPAPAPQATNRQKCIADITWGLGPKPEDCEGAIDEYLCCIWEMYVDACTRHRDCADEPWYIYILCKGYSVAANGVDTSACILGLPIPGA